METPRQILLFTYVTLNYFITSLEGSTPLCELCPCNSEPNSPPNINCISTQIDNIYDRKFWFDDSNTSYPIGSLMLENNNLRVLKTQFLASGLQSLDLSNNSISEIASGVFSQLQNMTELILGFNDLERIDPDSFRGVYNKNEYFPLKSLRSLDLKYNKLHTLDGDTFEHIDELEELRLSNNPFKVIDAQTVAAIASLVNLRVLDLSGTQINALPENFLHTPKYLKVLDLSGNNFEVLPVTLGDSHALEMLFLDNNPVYNLSEPNVFPNIPTLKTLHMSQMPVLKQIGAGALSGLESLDGLYLSHNKNLTYVHFDALALQANGSFARRLPLTEVFISYNNISYLGNNTLSWTKLKQLDLRGNPWACDCKNQWMINELLPAYVNINGMEAKELTCKYPTEMEGQSLYNFYEKKSVMRCLDFYSHSSEGGALILIGTLSGAITLVVIFMLILYIYRTKVLHLGPDSGVPRYSRL